MGNPYPRGRKSFLWSVYDSRFDDDVALVLLRRGKGAGQSRP